MDSCLKAEKENLLMKNYMPLIFAVLLGLAAVAGVSRLLSERKQASESTVYLVAAAREIGRNEEVTEGMIMRKDVPISAMPAAAVPWNRRNLLIGQKASRLVQMGDYLYYSDAGLSGSLGDVIGEGEWAVNLGGEKSIAHLLRPGDEVAILGTFSGQLKKDESEVAALLEKREIVTKGHGEVTVVLFRGYGCWRAPECRVGKRTPACWWLCRHSRRNF